MVETISPVVYGTRARWVGAVALHAVGAAATAAAFGAAVAAVGGLLGAPWGRAGAVLLVAIGVLYASRELLGVRVPVPQLRRQVPDWWRTYFGRPLAAVLYGAGLGIGFLTFLGHGTLVVVTIGAAISGRPAIGALVLAPFGLARGLAPLVSLRTADREDGRSLVERLSEMSDRVRSIVNGIAIVAVIASATALAGSAPGRWGDAAAAVLAAAFAWAGASKLLRIRRWRRALAEHHLPAPIERVATWAVPALELAIPTLTVLDRERAAALVALIALLSFTIVVVRAALRGDTDVPCGCFGASSVDVRAGLVRNLGLIAVAAGAFAAAEPDPTLSLPAGPDVVPAILAASALLAAAATAWRTSVWFSRGRA
jgi:uncharacterized membrane protein YphA (DoxX/SURF4 family)